MRKRFCASAIALVGKRRRSRGRSRLRSSAVTMTREAASSAGVSSCSQPSAIAWVTIKLFSP